MGAGQAGTQIVDRVFEHENMTIRSEPLAFNSTIQDLEELENVPRDRWFGLSAEYGLVPATESGFEEKMPTGFGQHPRHADEVMADHAGDIERVLDQVYSGIETEPSTLQFAFVFLGLGGGTGCGISPHLARGLREYGSSEMSVVAVAVLPNTRLFFDDSVDDDARGQQIQQCRNTVFGLDRLEEVVDSIVLVDNQRLAYDAADSDEFSDYNRYVATAFNDVVLSTEAERVEQEVDIDMQNVDLRDVVRFIEGSSGTAGYASIGRGVTMTKSLLGYLFPFGIGREPVDERELMVDAVGKQSLADVDPSDARSAVGVVRAPGSCWETDLSIGNVYEELSYYCRNVNMGWALTNRNLASVTALFGYEREDIGRIKEIERIAEHE
mgnify:CR=1 FL=1